MQHLFDLPEQYDAMLMQGIGLTGNDKLFFIKERLRYMVSRLKNPEKITKILDYGCGTGESSLELTRLFPDAQVYGTDLSENALRFAKENWKAPHLAFIALPEVADKKFDLIYLNCVLHHIPVSERYPLVEYLAQQLGEEGQIWIFENNPANPGTQWAMFRNPFDKGVIKVWPDQLRNWLLEAGIALSETAYLFYFPQWLAWFRPLEKYLVRFPLGGQYGVAGRKK